MAFFDKWFRKPSVPANAPAPQDNDLVVDLSKVVPRVKAISTGDTPDPNPRPNPEGPHLKMTFDDSPVYETFASGLGVFYAMDMGDRYQLLQNRHLTETITRQSLHSAALTNMTAEVSERTEINGDPAKVIMLTNGGNFEAAMLLADDMWVNLIDVFKDDICVAVPARDLLFIVGRNNPEGRESLRAMVRRSFDQQLPGLLVRHIYARENNKWVLIETV